jgi:hypothetical protein
VFHSRTSTAARSRMPSRKRHRCPARAPFGGRRGSGPRLATPLIAGPFLTDGVTWAEGPWVWDRSTSAWDDELTFDGKNPDFPGFTLEKVAFKAPTAGPVYVRFRLVSDQLVSSPLYTGIAIDDVVSTGRRDAELLPVPLRRAGRQRFPPP